MKILIVTKNWLGDILFEMPAIDMIHERYPEAEVVCIAPKRCHAILKAHPAVRRCFEFDEKKTHRSFLSKWKFAMELRKEHWDQAYLFHTSRTRAFVLWLAGVKMRLGFKANRKAFLTHPISEPQGDLHQAEIFIELLVRAGFQKPEKWNCRFYFTAHDQERARAFIQELNLESFVCFHLGANWEPKRWPAAYFAELADQIFNRYQVPVVLTGADRDHLIAEEVEAKVKKAKVISLIGRTSLGELGAFFQRALFVVSGDSGPMHIASGVETPVVALFGPTNPDLTGPRGSGKKVILSYIPEGYRAPWYGEMPKDGWLEHIFPEQVFQAIEDQGLFQKKDAATRSSKEIESISKLSIRNNHSRQRGNAATQHVLFVTLSNIGDVVLTTPVLISLAHQYPDAKITVVAGERAKGLLEGSQYVDRLVIYDKKASLTEKKKFLQTLRSEKYDCVVDMRNSLIPFLVSSKKRSPFVRRFRNISRRERHLEVLEKMQISANPMTFDFFSENEESSILQKIKEKAILSTRDWIIISPVAASSVKTWSLKGFQSVIQALLKQRSEDILLVGDAGGREVGEALSKIAPYRIRNFMGETTLRELGVLISRAAVVLANDSAIMHMAYELNRPTVALFGPTDHEKYGRVGESFRIIRNNAECSPCELAQCRLDRQICFEDLEANQVLEACLEFLHKDVKVS